MPALEQIRLVGGEDTFPAVPAPSAPHKGGGPEIALERAQTQPDLRRHGRGRPALAVQGPDLRMQRLAAGLALHGARRRRSREVVMGWHRHGQRPIRQRDGRLVPQGRDRVECLAVRAAHLVQGFPEMLQQRQAVRALCGCRSPGPSALGIGGRAIARAALAPWLFPEPQSEGLGRASREERDRVAALQIDQHGAVCLACPQRAVIHPKDRRQRERRGQRPPEQAQQRVPAHLQGPLVAKRLPGCPPQGHAQGGHALGQPQRAPGPGSRHGRQPFGADAATAAGIAAQPVRTRSGRCTRDCAHGRSVRGRS